MEYNLRVTTAEVAQAIITAPVRQMPGQGKGNAPKDLPDAKQGKPWDCAKHVQDCHLMKDVVLPGPNFVFVPCA